MKLGATPERGGTRFAVFSAHAEAVDLCLFNPDRVLPMQRDGDIWHVFVPKVGVGATYAFRAAGEWAPDRGLWFNRDRQLLDPYAREWTGPLRWSPDLQPDAPAGAADMPVCVVRDRFPVMQDRPDIPWKNTVIYEAHVRGMTMLNAKVPEHARGTFAGMGSPHVVRHLKRLGVTAVQLMPVQAFIDDRFVVERGLSNYWGYQTLGFFAPDPRYGTPEQFRSMVRRMHAAGIEVILDIVLNHSGEGDAEGPSVCFRGLDAPSYYRHADGRLLNEAGTGNTLDLSHPAVLRMAMDALRFWAGEMGVDGFRFDLATVLGRGADGFSPRASFFDAIRQDPILRDLKLIAEPWDIGPGGYRLGQFPPPFAEWNDTFRDDVRRFWRGEPLTGALASRLSGSAGLFDHDRRPATSSVNYLTAHDGFTLADLVTYRHAHNEANREAAHEYTDQLSDNMGAEGPNADLTPARDLRVRNMLATLFLSQGTPMLRAGDEMGNSQNGNSNAYSQDNEIGWIAWGGAAHRGFVARLAALREDCALLRQTRFLHGDLTPSGYPDILWRGPDGHPPDWVNGRALGMELNGTDDALFAIFNNGPACPFTLPDDRPWRLILDSTQPHDDAPIWGVEAPAHSVLVFRHTD
ncbi:glycogen debranching protein GlgX [Falsirhodobacter halotolerans]|uniref:glycogen debranching protein GlgX n=1 Tax=Falsirhodobacter halotolerans TaxID=1146892 RepID=UPI001FD2D4CE|nr:glycogen debranching protein GlgX [Falsirhodobacter halotolerans]MCJ8139703.1 glycogen debranching protein GlgX [Falsirhodobacter halotolerans]